jgi:hypothetical protein
MIQQCIQLAAVWHRLPRSALCWLPAGTHQTPTTAVGPLGCASLTDILGATLMAVILHTDASAQRCDGMTACAQACTQTKHLPATATPAFSALCSHLLLGCLLQHRARCGDCHYKVSRLEQLH